VKTGRKTAVATLTLTMVSAGLLAGSPAQAATLYHVENVNSGKCLLVQGTASNSPAVQYTCANYADQKWSFAQGQSGYVLIVNGNSQKCLVSRTSESQAVQSGCNASYSDQNWQLAAAGNFFQLKNKATGMCLVARGGSNGAPVVKTTCAAYADQFWALTT
jgi:hypothetical protein